TARSPIRSPLTKPPEPLGDSLQATTGRSIPARPLLVCKKGRRLPRTILRLTFPEKYDTCGRTKPNCIPLPRPQPYINSLMNARDTSGGIGAALCTSGPALSTGSSPCRLGTSVRSKNLPIWISSPHNKDFFIEATP